MQAFSPPDGAPVTPRELLPCDSETGDGGSSMEVCALEGHGNADQGEGRGWAWAG